MNAPASVPPAAAPELRWVAVAKLGKPRGSKGELTAFALGGGVDRFQALREAYLFRAPRAGRPALEGGRVEVESAWLHRGRLILKFRGVDNLSAADRLAGAEVRVPWSERAPLEAGHFFQSDLIGCQVVDCRSGESLGCVLGWQDTGGAGLLEVEGGWLLPFAKSICVEIDPAAKRIVVNLPEGLRDLNRP